MDEKMKKKWTNALRSGEYRQGRQALKTRDGAFCCLGVLCDIIPDNKCDDKWKDDPRYFGYLFRHETAEKDFVSSSTYLPSTIADAYDVNIQNAYELAKMNDNGSSFEEIADWIDEHM